MKPTVFGNLRRGLWIAVTPLVLAASPMIAGCRALEANACVLTLHGQGRAVSESCTSDAWAPHLAFQQPDVLADRNEDGWFETVLELDLAPSLGCSCVVFRVHFGEGVYGFPFNIGDSATNDGYGGDAGTDPIHSAELQLTITDAGPLFRIYSAAGNTPGMDSLLALNLPDLNGRFLELEICDQFVDFSLDGDRDSPGAGRMSTLDSQRLFAIAPPREASTEKDSSMMDSWIYAAFNRVIHQRRGPAAHGRLGRGVTRVEIFLTP